MKFILPVNKTSKKALYLLIMASCVFALIYMALAETDNTREMPKITHISEPGAPSEALCGLSAIVCPNEVVYTGVEKQIREIAQKTDFKWPDYLVRLARCESGLNPGATGDGGYNSRGLFQISKYYHPNISDECAYDIKCSTEWTIRKINAGQQNLWTCDRMI